MASTQLQPTPPAEPRKKRGLASRLLRGIRGTAKGAREGKASSMQAFLEAFGFSAGGARPTLSLSVVGHQEVEGHTFYRIQCLLVSDGFEPLRWQVQRRLRHLRMHWHDRVKGELGDGGYAELFAGCHFASRGGGRGTSKSLNAWCQRLAANSNAGGLPLSVVAHSLKFLEAPRQQLRPVAPGQTAKEAQPEAVISTPAVEPLAAAERTERPVVGEASAASDDCRCSATGSGDEFASGDSTGCSAVGVPRTGAFLEFSESEKESVDESLYSDSDDDFGDRVHDWDSDFMTDNESSDEDYS